MATVTDLFAGAGGFSLGFQQAGFTIARAVENHRPKAETYAANFPGVDLLHQDIQDTVLRERTDVVVGGPPCEPFTPANAARQPRPLDRLLKDKIGSLVLQFVRIVGDLRPSVFVMENVVQVAEDGLRDELVQLFSDHGFPRIHFNELSAEGAGVPSRRTRLFLSNVPIQLGRGPPAPTVGEALAGLPAPGSSTVPNHDPHPLSPDKVRRVEALAPGEALYGFTAASGNRHQNWTRLRADRVAPTIQGQGRFVHPAENRLLTVREHARLMGFPDSFVFRGGRDQQYDAVGESVPPPLAKAIAERLLAGRPTARSA